MNINLHIERLILEGWPLELRARARVQAAIEVELMRLLAAHGLNTELAAGGALSSLRAGALPAPPENNPEQLGTQIAQAVYGGIGAEVDIDSSKRSS